MPDESEESLLRNSEPATPAVKDPGLPSVKNPSLPIVNHGLEILCGPLLNYKGMQIVGSEVPVWHGSVLIVAKPGSAQPCLKLECLGVQRYMGQSGSPRPNDVDEPDNVRKGSTPNPPEACHTSNVSGVKLYSDSVKAFWRFAIDLTLQDHEARWQYALTDVQSSGSEPGTSPFRTFVVPSASQSMRIMFHSCNGFSVGTDEDEWSGPVLWNDALRMHAQKPFHAMVGGGDQIYNDGVRVDGPLKAWTDIGNPKKRRDYPFDEELRAACDSYYFTNYMKWFATEPFASANKQIPQINIWDDHDTIDGFGSYSKLFMKGDVFRGVGGVSYKYYCLFQHHIPPPKTSFTTPTTQKKKSRSYEDKEIIPVLPCETFVLEQQSEDSSFIIGARPGPYFLEYSRSLYMRLGARLAFLGVDARAERTRRRVNYPETYDLIFERVRSELSMGGNCKITHLVVLLGIPIAYPRLIWLETFLTSPVIGPIRFLSKRFGVAGGFFNRFDGQVEILDDLDDHYTARRHRQERKDLLLRLQSLAQDHNVRITILGGDVHLAALGRFYTKPELGIPVEHDPRYMANVISSAITNKPPPEAIADLLARRNRIHHLDHDTHETLMNMFDKNPGNSNRASQFNRCMMPSRNYAIISINPLDSVGLSHANGHDINGDDEPSSRPPKVKQSAKNGHFPLHRGEEGAGTEHPAASGMGEGTLPGGLDICFRVEVDHHDKEGRTKGYGFSIPPFSSIQMTMEPV